MSMRFHVSRAVSVLALLAALGVATSYGDLIISVSDHSAIADNTSGAPDTVTVHPFTIPLATSAFAADGSTVSQSMFTFTANALRFEFSHKVGDTGADFGPLAESLGTLSFSSTEPLLYQLSGEYNTVGLSRVVLEASFSRGAQTLFSNMQESRSSLDEQFLLGQQNGDFFNSDVNSPGGMSGVLLAGETYTISYDTLIQALADSASTGTATGFVQIDFLPIPEPGTGLLALALLGLGCARRRSL